MDLLVASMQTGRGAAPCQTTHVPRFPGKYPGTWLAAVGTVVLHSSRLGWLGALAARGGPRHPKGHKDVSSQRADPQWYAEQDAKPASCGTTLRAPAPAGIFFLDTGT